MWTLKRVDSRCFVTLNGLKIRKQNGDEFGHIVACCNSRNAGQIMFKFSNSTIGRHFIIKSFLSNEEIPGLTADLSSMAFQRQLEAIGISRQKRAFMAQQEEIQTVPKRAKFIQEGAEEIKMTNTLTMSKPSFTSKSRDVFNVNVSLLTLAQGPYIVRERRKEWTNIIKDKLKRAPYKVQVTLPVLVDPACIDTTFDPANIGTYEYIVLGGNHLVEAVKVLLQEVHIPAFSNFNVEVYVDLTIEEARSVANQHNARSQTLEITFQDKVRQARKIKEEGVENLGNSIAKMLSDITLKVVFKLSSSCIFKEVAPCSCTTIVSVAKYSQQDYSIVEEIFTQHEYQHGIGKKVPEKFFRILQCPVFSDLDRTALLIKAKDEGIHLAAKQAQEQKNIKVTKNTFRDAVSASTWEEVVSNYPSHSTEPMIKRLSEVPSNTKYVSKALSSHIASAVMDQEAPSSKEDIVDIQITINGSIISHKEMSLVEKEISALKRKLLKLRKNEE